MGSSDSIPGLTTDERRAAHGLPPLTGQAPAPRMSIEHAEYLSDHIKIAQIDTVEIYPSGHHRYQASLVVDVSAEIQPRELLSFVVAKVGIIGMAFNQSLRMERDRYNPDVINAVIDFRVVPKPSGSPTTEEDLAWDSDRYIAPKAPQPSEEELLRGRVQKKVEERWG